MGDEKKDKLTESAYKIQFHYIFSDESHNFNAYTRNSCEKDFLNIIRTLSEELRVKTDVDVEPKKEGGLIDIYNFLVSSSGVAIAAWGSLFIGIIAILMSLKTKKDKLEQDLDIHLKILSLIEKVKELKKQNIPIPLDIQKTLQKLDTNTKLKKQKSNFFKKLSNEKKIKELEIITVDEKNPENNSSMIIKKQDFSDYILDTDNLDSEFDKKAKLEIISPVLKNGRYHWRAYYEKGKATIEFSMLDKDFKDTVVDDGLPFQNGTFIDCEMEICRKLDENGDVFNSHYKVHEVYNHYLGETITEMPKGKERRLRREIEKQQINLFDEFNTDEI